MGSLIDIKPPQKITAEALSDALKKHDPITKYRPSVAEPCVLACRRASKDEKPMKQFKGESRENGSRLGSSSKSGSGSEAK